MSYKYYFREEPPKEEAIAEAREKPKEYCKYLKPIYIHKLETEAYGHIVYDNPVPQRLIEELNLMQDPRNHLRSAYEPKKKRAEKKLWPPIQSRGWSLGRKA